MEEQENWIDDNPQRTTEQENWIDNDPQRMEEENVKFGKILEEIKQEKGNIFFKIL